MVKNPLHCLSQMMHLKCQKTCTSNPINRPILNAKLNLRAMKNINARWLSTSKCNEVSFQIFSWRIGRCSSIASFIKVSNSMSTTFSFQIDLVSTSSTSNKWFNSSFFFWSCRRQFWCWWHKHAYDVLFSLIFDDFVVFVSRWWWILGKYVLWK